MKKNFRLFDKKNAKRKYVRWKNKVKRKFRKQEEKKISGGVQQVKFDLSLKTKVIKPPKVFSLTKNYEESINCLNKLKEEVFNPVITNGRRAHINIDLAEIEELQPAAAIVLAAEMDRWSKLCSIKLTPIALNNWSDQVLKLCSDLGMFTLLEILPNHQKSVYERLQKYSENDNIDIALKLVSHNRNNRQLTDQLAENLSNKVPSFRNSLSEEGNMAISTALTEASLNSVNHAYKYKKLKYPSYEDRWWASAVFQSDGDYVKFFVYDQGAGIPDTLPRSDTGKKILNRMFGGNDSLPYTDSGKVKAALTTEITSTRESNRGKGLPQIVKAVSNRGGSLRVLSGKGSVTCKDGNVNAERDYKMHIGGTLLEWTFEIGAM